MGGWLDLRAFVRLKDTCSLPSLPRYLVNFVVQLL